MEPIWTPSPTPISTPEPTPEPTTEPTPEPFYSKTTGLSFVEEPEYHPITVMIENSAEARPQTGLMQADIIYEAPAEGGITRFLCLFNDTLPIEVGPVRSTRIYFLRIQREWDSVMVHYGGPSDVGRPSYVYGEETDNIKVRVDGIKGRWSAYFWRSTERSAPHNVYSDLTLINEELYDYTPEYRGQFRFDVDVDLTGGESFTEVSLTFQSGDLKHTQFVYDEETGRLMRFVGGEPFMVRTVTLDNVGEKQTATEQYSCQNLIVMSTSVYIIQEDSSGRRMVEMVGSGACDYFIGGRHFTGTWRRDSLDDATQYLLSDGTPLTLLPGNTWVAVHPTSGTITIG